MQYQSTLDRDGLIDLARDRYFGNVDAGRIDAAAECFHPEALFTVQTAFATFAGRSAIREMLANLVRDHSRVVHRDLRFTVDPRNGRMAASFVADLTDHHGNTRSLANTNFWRVRGDRFQEVYVYMSGANVLG